MAQPTQNFPIDSKVNDLPPQTPAVLHTQLSPPAYPSSSYPAYAQQTGLQQPSQFGAMPPQQLPRGAMSPQQVPMGTLTPQATMSGVPQQQYPVGTYPAQQAPLGTYPAQQVPVGTYPAQQVPVGMYPAQPVQMGVPLAAQPLHTQAQIGQQYQAAQYAQCAYGNHARTTKYGVVGIIGAIVFFPIGLLCMLADKEEVCLRCGQRC